MQLPILPAETVRAHAMEDHLALVVPMHGDPWWCVHGTRRLSEVGAFLDDLGDHARHVRRLRPRHRMPAAKLVDAVLGSSVVPRFSELASAHELGRSDVERLLGGLPGLKGLLLDRAGTAHPPLGQLERLTIDASHRRDRYRVDALAELASSSLHALAIPGWEWPLGGLGRLSLPASLRALRVTGPAGTPWPKKPELPEPIDALAIESAQLDFSGMKALLEGEGQRLVALSLKHARGAGAVLGLFPDDAALKRLDVSGRVKLEVRDVRSLANTMVGLELEALQLPRLEGQPTALTRLLVEDGALSSLVHLGLSSARDLDPALAGGLRESHPALVVTAPPWPRDAAAVRALGEALGDRFLAVPVEGEV